LNGIYTYNVDGKGRIVMPSRFLDKLGNPFVLAGNPQGYLVAAPRPEMLPESAVTRGYVECSIRDRTGRFVIPSALREFADLKQLGEANVIGMGDGVEIWNKQKWEVHARPSQLSDSRRAESSEQFIPYSLPASSSPGVIIRQKALYGQPYFEVEGMLTAADTDRVLTRLETALRGRPRTLFLDLRGVETIDASLVIGLEPLLKQLTSSGGRMAILTERSDMATLIERLCGHKYLRVFPNLESGLWWLADEGYA